MAKDEEVHLYDLFIVDRSILLFSSTIITFSLDL